MRLQPLFSQEDMVPRKEVVIRQHSSPNAMPLGARLQGYRTHSAFRCSSRSWAVFPRWRSPTSWAWGKRPSASGSREPGGSSKNAMPQYAARWCAIRLPPQNNSVSLLRLVRESRWLSPPGGLRSLTEHEHVSTSWWQRTVSLASLSTLRLDNVATTTATHGRKRRVPVTAWVVPLSMTT